MHAIDLPTATSPPADGTAGTLVGRAWLPGEGPAMVVVNQDSVFDIGRTAPTCAGLLNKPDPAAIVAAAPLDGRIGDIEAVLADSAAHRRDPADLVTHAIGPTRQYRDGFVLFLGTMSAPVEDRDTAGQGFTHKQSDIVTIASPKLGALVNRIGRGDWIPSWEFGALAPTRNLGGRSLP